MTGVIVGRIMLAISPMDEASQNKPVGKIVPKKTANVFASQKTMETTMSGAKRPRIRIELPIRRSSGAGPAKPN